MGQQARPTGAVAVCRDPEVASILVGSGIAVLLCGPDGVALADVVRALRDAGGRVGCLVGDPADPDVQAAAVGMARDLFGGDPVVVETASHARHLKAGSGTVDPHPYP